MQKETYIEIEKKFLVTEDFKNHIKSSHKIVQGYLSHDPKRTVRVRIIDEKGFLNIKGETTCGGVKRFEWEKGIPKVEAEMLLGLCSGYIVDKTRHLVDYGEHLFEVDEFHGENEGLVVAEIELSAVDESFQRPQWLGLEVSQDIRYYNSELSITPYLHW